MPPVGADIPRMSRHYHVLADYACARGGTHVFFFLQRRIIYGGQVVGSREYEAFILNGPNSPLGRLAGAEVCWDESTRSTYTPTAEPGIFEVPNVGVRCQPYLIRFDDRLGLRGKVIRSDDLYWRLGEYWYPLPSNSIQDMGFCTLTPGEAEVALACLEESSAYLEPDETGTRTELTCHPTPFHPRYGVQSLAEAFEQSTFFNEAHLEASLILNPSLLPGELRPSPDDAICRQVPISPFKPYHMDRADVCFYSGSDRISDGTIPNVLFELKNARAGAAAVRQVERYLDWLYRILEAESAARIKAYVLAPSYARNITVGRYREQIELLRVVVQVPPSLF